MPKKPPGISSLSEGQRSQSKGPKNFHQSGQVDDITLADLLEVISRRKGLAVSAMAFIMIVTIIFTGLAPATYESSASLIPVHEPDEIVAIMSSRAFMVDVADKIGLTSRFGSGERAVSDLQGRVDILKKWEGEGPEGMIVVVSARADTAQAAAQLADTYVATLAEWEPYLREITWGKKWESYYEDMGKDSKQATAALNALVDNMTYWQPLDSAMQPPNPVSPQWQRNLGIGFLVGTLSTIGLPFIAEGVSNARVQLHNKKFKSTISIEEEC